MNIAENSGKILNSTPRRLNLGLQKRNTSIVRAECSYDFLFIFLKQKFYEKLENQINPYSDFLKGFPLHF